MSGLLPIGVAGIVGDFVLSVAGFRELFLTAAGFAVVTLFLCLPLPERRPKLKPGQSPKGFWKIVIQRDLLPIWWMIGSFSTVLTGYFVFIRRYVDDTGFGSVGLFFSTYVAVAILERVFLGWLPDRVGRMRVLYPSLGILVIGFFILAGAGSWASLGILVIGFFILAGAGSWAGVAIAGAFCGAGHGFIFPILTSLLVDRAPDTDRGSAMSFFTALFDVGTLIGGPVLGAIIDSAGWGPMYVVAGLALGVASVIFWRWNRWVMIGESEASIVAGA